MKIIGVIPARYESSRFPGKPLADICGKPMIWWVYNRVIKSQKLDKVFVLLDDDRIANYCESESIEYIMTRKDHPNHIDRVREGAEFLCADVVVCVNGDEPLIQSSEIDKVIPDFVPLEVPYFMGATRKFNFASEVVDPANIKITLDKDMRCLYMSRSAIPFPKGTLDFSYYKYIGIECFNKKALDLFVNKEMGNLEKIEDIDHLRFLENGVQLFFTLIESESISVDTKKDLDFARSAISKMIENGEIDVCVQF